MFFEHVVHAVSAVLFQSCKMSSQGKYCAKTVKEKEISREVDEQKSSKYQIAWKHGIPPSTLPAYIQHTKQDDH